MSFRDDGKVYLEVGVNEDVSKDENPNVPYGAEETARDVVECIQRGATAVNSMPATTTAGRRGPTTRSPAPSWLPRPRR